MLRSIQFNLQLLLREFIEWCRVLWHYYRKPKFALIDLLLFCQYLMSNPYRLTRKFFSQSNLEILSHREPQPQPYGETPLTSFARIAKATQLSSNDLFYELGCGRGRLAYWTHCFIGCKVVCADVNPIFIRRGKILSWICRIKKIQWLRRDFTLLDFSSATVVYLFGTTLSDQTMQRLMEQFKFLPENAQVITVSYSLEDYFPGHWFDVTHKLQLNYSWGKTDAYIQRRTAAKGYNEPIVD